jgi:hypothetical protein
MTVFRKLQCVFRNRGWRCTLTRTASLSLPCLISLRPKWFSITVTSFPSPRLHKITPNQCGYIWSWLIGKSIIPRVSKGPFWHCFWPNFGKLRPNLVKPLKWRGCRVRWYVIVGKYPRSVKWGNGPSRVSWKMNNQIGVRVGVSICGDGNIRFAHAINNLSAPRYYSGKSQGTCCTVMSPNVVALHPVYTSSVGDPLPPTKYPDWFYWNGWWPHREVPVICTNYFALYSYGFLPGNCWLRVK